MPALQPAEQLPEQTGEFVLPLRVEHGQYGGLVGELLGQDPVDQVAAGVGEADVSDAAVAGVAAAFDQAALGELLEALGDGGAGGEGLAGQLAGGQLVAGAAQRAEQVELGAAQAGPAQRARPRPAGGGRRSG